MPKQERQAQQPESEAEPKWFEARLINSRGLRVATVRALPFRSTPEIMVHEDRYFVRRPGSHDYNEAGVHFVTPEELG